LDRYAQDLRKFTNATTATLRARGAAQPAGDGERNGRPDARPRVRLGGVIHTLKLRNSKRGDRYATFVLEDKEGTVEVIAWPEAYRRHEAIIQSGAPVVVAGALDVSDDRCQVIADEVAPLAAARAEAIRQVHVRVPLPALGRDGLETLRTILAAHPGPCDAFLHLERGGDDHETIVALPSSVSSTGRSAAGARSSSTSSRNGREASRARCRSSSPSSSTCCRVSRASGRTSRGSAAAWARAARARPSSRWTAVACGRASASSTAGCATSNGPAGSTATSAPRSPFRRSRSSATRTRASRR